MSGAKLQLRIDEFDDARQQLLLSTSQIIKADLSGVTLPIDLGVRMARGMQSATTARRQLSVMRKQWSEPAGLGEPPPPWDEVCSAMYSGELSDLGEPGTQGHTRSTSSRVP
eukprot:SAG31_NODE_4841_length_2911_cov_19.155761_3_plen_112_part_00